MSKVKSIDGIKKSKLIKQLRRKETFKKNNDKFTKYYKYGYYVHDEELEYFYEDVEVPEKVYETLKYKKVYHNIYDNDGNLVDYHSRQIPYIERKVVPAHTEHRIVGREWVKVTPKVRRVDISNLNNYCKKQTNRIIRNQKIDDENVYNKSSYRKVFERNWTIW